jgi:hypothetical protein
MGPLPRPEGVWGWEGRYGVRTRTWRKIGTQDIRNLTDVPPPLSP